jgi:SAM-dependent methyltransferase
LEAGVNNGRAKREPLRPEHELILRCARAHLHAEAAERIPELLKQELDWSLLVASAVDQYIDPLVYSQLRTYPRGAVPADWMEFLQNFSRTTVVNNLNLTCHLIRILELFQSKGILAIPYKGPVLAALAYGNLALRRFMDLDLLVRQSDLAVAAELLSSQGYQALQIEGFSATKRGDRIPGQYLFRSELDECLVELHTERTLRYFPKPIDINDLEKRLVPVCLGKKPISTLSLEDLLCFVCVHGTKHMWDRLQWIFDVAMLARIPRAEDWPRIEERAREMQCQRMVDLGLYLAKDFIDAPLPEDLWLRLKADRSILRMADAVQMRRFRGASKMPGILQRAAFRVRSIESPWRGLRYCMSMALRPTEDDWRFVPMPKTLGLAYPLLRPFFLLRKYGLGLRDKASIDLAPFVPTPQAVLDRMIEMADIGSEDVLYDLGCGDGRIVVAAAKRYGIRCVGVDVDPERIREGKANARRAGVKHLVRFIEQDAKTVNLSEATVVTMWLTDLGVAKLKEKLRTELRPGARIVSRDFRLLGWEPEKSEVFPAYKNRNTRIMLWRISNETSPLADEHGLEDAERESSISAAGK